MTRKILPFALFLFVIGTTAPNLLAVSVNLDPATAGRPFEGIGAISAGGNSRLLIDYEEPYRGDVLDFLFKPNFGAAMPYLKVELGGGTNSTCGAEPSHAITPDELHDPVSRGYEFWLMHQARRCNPDIELGFLPWAFPYWLGTPFQDPHKQNFADYFTSFMIEARDQWGVTVDWVSAAKNEHVSTDDLPWIRDYLRPTMNAAGFSNVKILAPDDYGSRAWDLFWPIVNDPSYDAVIDAVGYHYVDQLNKYPSQSIINNGKTLWCTEDRVWTGDWFRAREIVRRMNKLYAQGRITQMQIWCPVDSCIDGVVLEYTGVMQADSPWSGHYIVRPSIWTTAHYNQFAPHGWRFLDGACGPLSGAGNYAALKDPASNHWSMIIYTDAPETIDVTIAPGLATGPVHVWRSTESEQFVQLPDVVPSGNVFTLDCTEPDAVYSITTTTGQQKGAAPSPIPDESPWPLPYADDFENYPIHATPRYISDMQGTFEIAQCLGDRIGQCLQQTVPNVGNTWGFGWVNPDTPMTLFGSKHWANYETSADVFIQGGEVYLAVRRGTTQKTTGYALVLDKSGFWRLCLNNVTSEKTILASGVIPGFDPAAWHNLKVRAVNNQLDGYIDNIRVCSLDNVPFSKGQPCLGSSFHLNQFDNLQAYPAGPQDAADPWSLINDNHPTINWNGGTSTWQDRNHWIDDTYRTLTAGNSVNVPFYGAQVAIIGLLQNNLGVASIYIDNVYQTTIDCFSPQTTYQYVLFCSDPLPLGNHTLRLVATGAKNPSSLDSRIVIDAFLISQAENPWCYVQPLEQPILPEPLNLARAATAYASSVWDAGYTADKANDGDWNSRWNSVQGDINGSWLAMDFHQPTTFNRVRFNQFLDRVQNYKIQYWNNNQWNDAHVGATISTAPEIVDFPAVTGSKARLLVVTSSKTPSIYEFEIYNYTPPTGQFKPLYVDLNSDSQVDLKDLNWLCAQWLAEDCDLTCPCDKADLYHDNHIDLHDFTVLQSRMNQPH